VKEKTMKQQARQSSASQRLDQSPPPPSGPGTPGQVRIIAGADVQDLELAGRTVAEARMVATALFGVGDGAVALIDGREAGEEQLLGPGEVLEFVKHAGVKGALPRRVRSVPAVRSTIEMIGDRAVWRRNGKEVQSMRLRDLWERSQAIGIGPQGWAIYPRMVRLMAARRGGTVTGVVIEMPPGPRRVRWIADDSPAPYGPGSRYESRFLSFPWVVLVIVFVGGSLSGYQQAFFRTVPLASLDDPLCYTNLLNVAEGYGQESWVCLTGLRGDLSGLAWDEKVTAVTEHFWQAAFNRSSEEHEGNSYWGRFRQLDPRLASADAWEAASRADPYFALGIEWPRASRPVGRVLFEMLDAVAPARPIERVEHLVTLMQQSGADTA
jgi:hypothetical protein